jgi:hypothetical protein
MKNGDAGLTALNHIAKKPANPRLRLFITSALADPNHLGLTLPPGFLVKYIRISKPVFLQPTKLPNLPSMLPH